MDDIKDIDEIEDDLEVEAEGDEILTPKEILSYYPIIGDIVRFIPDEMLEMLLAPLKMMAPIYTMMYQFEHMLEQFIEPFLFGESRETSDNPLMKCMEGRYNLVMQKYLKPFFSMLPGAGQLFDIFIQLHMLWVKYCPTYLLMSLVAPSEFAKRKYFENFPEPEIDCGSFGFPKLCSMKED